MWLARLGVQFVLVLRADYIAMMEEREVPCCVKGHHVYQAMWVAVVGEELACEREPTNADMLYKGWSHYWASAKNFLSLFSAVMMRGRHRQIAPKSHRSIPFPNMDLR